MPPIPATMPREVPDDVAIAYARFHGLPHVPGRRLRVLYLNIDKLWFDMAKSGARREEARKFGKSYDKRLANGLQWDVIEFVNGYVQPHVRVHWAIWLNTRVVSSYKVTGHNGTKFVVYESDLPHYVVDFVNF